MSLSLVSELTRYSGRFTNNYYINPAPFLPTTHFFIPSSMTSKEEAPITSEAVAQKFLEYVSPPPAKNGRIVPSPLSGTEPENGIDWEDVRVQSWNAEERHDNGAYIEKSVELNKAIKSMQASPASSPSSPSLSMLSDLECRTLRNSRTVWVPIRRKRQGPSSR